MRELSSANTRQRHYNDAIESFHLHLRRLEQGRRKRSVHVADVRERRIWRVERGDWDLGSVLELARSLAERGPVLVGLDLAFGVPAGYWGKVLEVPGWRDAKSFVEEVGDPVERKRLFREEFGEWFR